MKFIQKLKKQKIKTKNKKIIKKIEPQKYAHHTKRRKGVNFLKNVKLLYKNGSTRREGGGGGVKRFII